MKFAEEDRKQALRWLQEKGSHAVCEICQKSTWTLLEHIVMVPIFRNATLNPNQAYPMILLLCSSCGNTKFLHPKVMGLFPDMDKNG